MGGFQRHFRSRRGAAGVLAVVTCALLLLVGGAYVTLSRSERGTAAFYRDGIAAQYLAEAGLQDGIARLRFDTGGIRAASNSLTGISWNSSGPLNSGATAGTYRVTVYKSATDTAQTRTVSAVGTLTQANGAPFTAQRTMVATVNLGGGSGAFQNVLYAGTQLSIAKNTDFYGDVTVDGNIVINSRTTISSGIFTAQGGSGTVTAGTGGTIAPYGAVTETFPVNFSTANTQYAGATILAAFPRSLSTGMYRINGNARLNNDLNTTGNVTVYVDGDLTVDGQTDINKGAAAGNNLLLVVKNNININANFNMTNTVLIAGGAINIAGQTDVNGALIAQGGININANSNLTYNNAAVQSLLGVAGNQFLATGSGAGSFSISKYRNR